MMHSKIARARTLRITILLAGFTLGALLGRRWLGTFADVALTSIILIVVTASVIVAMRYVKSRVAITMPQTSSARLAWHRAFHFWKDYVWTSETRAMRLTVALACIFIVASIGYVYALDITVRGWQLWVWIICVVTIVVALMPSVHPPLHITRIEIAVFGLAFVALLLRITFLENVPGGLHVDEMGAADFALRQVFPKPDITINPFITGPVSQPSLFFYLLRLALAVAGHSITGTRILSAIVGALAIAATYGAIAILQDRRTALLTAIVMTAYHYHIHWSRIGLNNIWDTLWVPLMLGAFAWGWKRNWSGGAVLSGAALGLAQYFYQGNKIGAFLLVFVIFWLWRQERDPRRLIVHVGKLALVAVCIAAPLALFALRDPQPYFERARIVFAWSSVNIGIETHGTYDLVGYAWSQAWRSFGAFTAVPDITGFYGPGVPLVIGLAAVLFIIGFFWAIYKRQFIPVLWILLTTILGGFLSTGAPSSSHYVVAIPAICWLIAIPLSWLMEHGQWRLALAMLLAVVVTDLGFYFGVYVPSHPRDLIGPFPPGFPP